MKPKRELKLWVKIALLLLPQAVIIGMLFFLAVKIDTEDITVEIHQHNGCMLEVLYE